MNQWADIFITLQFSNEKKTKFHIPLADMKRYVARTGYSYVDNTTSKLQ